jgi:hypothetical protein
MHRERRRGCPRQRSRWAAPAGALAAARAAPGGVDAAISFMPFIPFMNGGGKRNLPLRFMNGADLVHRMLASHWPLGQKCFTVYGNNIHNSSSMRRGMPRHANA